MYHDDYKLQNCSLITSITIRNSIISNNGLKALTKCCHNLSSIILDFETVDEHDHFVSDTALYDLTKHCKKLLKINIVNGLAISAACKKHITQVYGIEFAN